MRAKSATVAPLYLGVDYERFLKARHTPGKKRSEPHVFWTTANFVHFPDGDIQVTGAHLARGKGRGCARVPATEEEKVKKEADRARRRIKTACKYHNLNYLWTRTHRGCQPDWDLEVELHEEWVRRVRRVYP